MTSPLLGLMNGDDPSPYGSLFDDPRYQRQRMWDAMGGLGVALMQASAPSPYPRDIGGVLGQGLAGASAGMSNSEDRYLRRALTDAQVAKARSDIKQAAEWKNMVLGVGEQPAAAGSASSPAAAPAPGTPLNREQAAISSIEGDYSSVGPETKGPNGQPARGYGKYQVMDFNIPTWTQEVLGTSMTPDQFLKDTKAQDAVFNTKFGQYIKKFGNHQDAASAWFSGMPLQQAVAAGNKPDVLGTTPTAYVDQFNKAFAGAGGPVVPGMAIGSGDASGSPVRPVQYTPPPRPPQTIREALEAMPQGVRQIVGNLGPKEGMNFVLKYLDPSTETVLDTQTGQVVFIPKTMVGRNARYQPVQGAELDIKRQTLANSQRKTDIDERNADVIIGNDGRPMVNQQAVDAKRAVSAAQGSGALEPHADKVLIDQGSKAHDELQGTGLKSRTALAQINRLASLLDQVNTGKFTTTTTEIKAMAKGLGIDLSALGVKDDTGPAQAAAALSNQFALTLRDPSSGGGMPGALSDSDRKYLAAMVPGLETTPEGRKLMVDLMKRLHQRNIDLAKVANDYVRGGGLKRDPAGLYAQLQQYADANPLFDPQKDALSGTPGGGAPSPQQQLYDRYGLKPAPGAAPAGGPGNLYDKYGLKPR